MAVKEGADNDSKDKEGTKGKNAKGKEEEEPELSEEDLELKKNLEMMIERLSDPDPGRLSAWAHSYDPIGYHCCFNSGGTFAGVQKLALQSMINEIRSSTASMTSVPKPLKFLNMHIDALAARCEELPPSENRSNLADIVSVLATTVAGKEGERKALKFRLMGSHDQIGVWGHEYLRHLAGEISEDFNVGT
jgi:26S proteasome regulatory subunit N1